MKTLIAIPCMDAVQMEFCQSLVQMRYVGEIQFGFTSCSLIYQARTQLCKMAMEANADYVLWLDSDVSFPPSLMEDMMTAIQGRDMVTGIYHMRRPPFRPVIWKTLKTGLLPQDCTVEPYDDYPDGDLFEIDGCGFGAVLMKIGVIKDVAETFHETFTPIPGFGEDLSFCIRVKSCGYKMYADPRIQVGHKGSMIINQNTFRSFMGRMAEEKRGEDHADGMQTGNADH